MSVIKFQIGGRAANFCSFFCLIFLLLIAPAEAAWQTIGNVARLSQTKPNGVILDTSSRARVSVEFFDLNVIRIRVAPNGTFERDFSYAIDYSRDRKTPSVKVSQTAGEIVLTNGFGARVVIQKMPFAVRILDE